MTTVERALSAAASIEGAFAVALVDYETGMTLGSRGGSPGFDLDVAAPGNSGVVRAKLAVMDSLGITDSLEDILITLSGQYHLIRPLGGRDNERLFFYLALNRSRANLAMARRDLRVIADQLYVDESSSSRPDGSAQAGGR
jgi:hypothetical protein